MLFSRFGGTGTSAVTTKVSKPAAATRSTSGSMRSGIAGEIGLVPGGGIFLDDVFQPDQRRRAEDHRHVQRRRRARVDDVAAIGAQRRRAHRRNAERRGVGLAEQRRGLVARGDVVEHARHKTVFVERLAVVAHRRIGLGAAGDIAIEEFRQQSSRGRLEIVEAEIALQRRGTFETGRMAVGEGASAAVLSSTLLGPWAGLLLRRRAPIGGRAPTC